jgi:ElaB/YqjD/DUF883 family membrane-anchored ribosome-binding protein
MEAKRQAIKERISAAQTRNDMKLEPSLFDQISEQAVVAKDEFTAFARKHPVATVVGGVALGVLISAFFKNSPTRKAGRYAGEKAVGLATLGSEAVASFAQHLMESTADVRQAGVDKLEDVNDALGDKARKVKRDAAYKLDSVSDAARITARDLGKSLARSLRKD